MVQVSKRFVCLCVISKIVNCYEVVRRDCEPFHSGEQTQCSAKVIQSSISTQQLEGQGTLACSHNNNEGRLDKWWFISCLLQT